MGTAIFTAIVIILAVAVFFLEKKHSRQKSSQEDLKKTFPWSLVPAALTFLFLLAFLTLLSWAQVKEIESVIGVRVSKLERQLMLLNGHADSLGKNLNILETEAERMGKYHPYYPEKTEKRSRGKPGKKSE